MLGIEIDVSSTLGQNDIPDYFGVMNMATRQRKLEDGTSDGGDRILQGGPPNSSLVYKAFNYSLMMLNVYVYVYIYAITGCVPR